jgi:hypothetical protein
MRTTESIPDAWKLTNSGTIFSAFELTGTPVAGTAIIGVVHNSAGTSPFNSYLLSVANANSYLSFSYNHAGTFGSVTAATVLSQGRNTVAATFVTANAQPLILYQNGAVASTTTWVGAAPTYSATAGVKISGDFTTPSRILNGNTAISLMYNRVLTPAEIAKLDREPFCMLRPLRRPVFAKAASGGAAKALVSAQTAASSEAAAIRRIRAQASAQTASSAQAALMGRSRPIAAAQSASSTSASALGRTRGIAAAITATSTQAASFNGQRALVEAIAASAVQTAAVSRSRAVIAAEASSAVQAAALARARALAASETAISAVSASLTADHVLHVPLWASSGPGPQTKRHYAAGSNFDGNGDYILTPYGFNLADVSSVAVLDALPDGVLGLVWLGLGDGADSTFISTVTPFIGHPKLYGFYLYDEPIPGTIDPANLKAESDWIHANVPGAIVFLALENEGTPSAPSYSFNAANTGADLFGIDPYPVRAQFSGGIDLSVIAASVNAAVSAGIPLAQIVPVYQAFGGGGYPSWTVPTPDQTQDILRTWAGLVPAPVFDYVYAWGEQLGDTALVDLPEQQAIFTAHNAVSPTQVARSRALSASLSANTSQTASTHALGGLGAAITAIASQAAGVARSRPLAAAQSASTSQAAALHGIRPVAASLSVGSAQAVSVTRSRRLTAAVSASADQQATVVAIHPGLNSQHAAALVQSASLSRSRSLHSAQPAGADQSATLHGHHAIAAAITAVETQAAGLTRTRPLTSQASAVSTLSVTFISGRIFGSAHTATSAQVAPLIRHMANTRPRTGRLLVVPADQRTLIVPADIRILPPGV